MIDRKSEGATRTNKKAEIPKDIKTQLLYYMKLTREIEYRIERVLYRQGKIVGGVYVGRGQEAISVGTGMLMGENDVATPTHRDMGIFLLRGISPRRIIAQYMGRKTGVTKGKDGNMHMGDLKHNIIAFVSHLGDNVPVAAGVALSFKMRGEDRVAFCYNGEGATSRGDWHEGVNLAAVHKLPVVFFINNNQYAYSTPMDLQMATENVADRAPGYSMPGDVVDGNDVLAVYESAKRAVDWARSGKGPYLVEYKTFRMTGHSAHDDAGYVPKELFEEWKKKDPIERLVTQMTSRNEITNEEIERMDNEITAVVDDAVEWADKSPYPDPEDCLRDVYYDR
ncbi:MAG: thiamine pyrophosphate-dependent dehydrogenase E1 component subunit alpha [Candidatus Latescibacterota bacterium]|nr:MAG: thiamine pyrophosphate-dependent dehydrogenase E1 component subunit alpha [Candidatus Latescibacterota bacterium]